MNFNKHSMLEGSHAFLSASQNYWLRYDDQKLIDTFRNRQAAERGTELHELACKCIKLGVKLKGENNLANYVNDAIKYGMTPEQVLFYSEYCYGTADAISFRNNKLRIHDLKTGTSPVHIEQLFIYAALFCIEYQVRPGDIEIELRIYQNDEVQVCVPTVEDISYTIDRIRHCDNILREANKKGE